MMRPIAGALIALSLTLVACSEKGRTVGADAAPYTGPSGSMATFAAPGWKSGDKTSWEQSMKVRAQYGQNDHSR
jgi:hypothetical protein